MERPRRLHFDTVARLYEAARPGYPEILIDDLVRLSGVGPGSSVIDIGCGTGKSTEPFARRGFTVCALDPGENMLAVCRERLGQYANVSFELSAFETFTWAGALFDLAISGTAFHWITAAGRAQLLRVLDPQGSVGIFWHTYLNGRGSFYDRLDRIYHDHAPGLYVADLQAAQDLADRRKQEELLAWEELTSWRSIRYYGRVSYDAQGYLDLLRTWSTHADLTDEFYTAVASAIEDTGGRIAKPVRTTLCFGRRQGARRRRADGAGTC